MGAVEATPQELDAGRELVDRALAEDLGGEPGVDLTAVAVSGAVLSGHVIARAPGTICGTELAAHAFHQRGVELVELLVHSGVTVAAGTALLRVEGDAAAVLAAERVALNVLARLSGTATMTAAFVEAIAAAGLATAVCDTRKTTPLMRAPQRWAVRCGGGTNHRFGLADEAMLKDNHLAACAGDIATAVGRIRAAHPGVRVHVEADTFTQVERAVDAGADVVLLDNMSPPQLAEAVRLVAGRAITEASGGVTLDAVAALARSGVDRISVGALTHSAPAFDVALDADVDAPA